MLLPIIMIVICLVGGGTAYFFVKKSEQNKYKDKNIPEMTANEFNNVKDICGNGFCCEGNGSYHTSIPNCARAFGLNVESVPLNEPQKLIDALANGKLVVALMEAGHFTSSGHFIVMRGVTADGKILVADPISRRKSEMEWDIASY